MALIISQLPVLAAFFNRVRVRLKGMISPSVPTLGGEFLDEGLIGGTIISRSNRYSQGEARPRGLRREKARIVVASGIYRLVEEINGYQNLN